MCSAPSAGAPTVDEQRRLHYANSSARDWLADGRGLRLLLAHDLSAGLALDPFVVAETFGLTPAEARIAVALARGRSIAAGLTRRCRSRG